MGLACRFACIWVDWDRRLAFVHVGLGVMGLCKSGRCGNERETNDRGVDRGYLERID